MLSFVQEILQGLEQNTITRLDLFVTHNLQKLQFQTYGSIGRSFESSLPVDCVGRPPFCHLLTKPHQLT